MLLNLLIVDDSEADAFLACRALRRAGYETRWCCVDSPGQLHDALHRGGWDVVLCDAVTTRLDARAVAAVLHDQAPRLPVLLYSAREPRELEGILRDTSFHGIVAKDRCDILADTVRALLGRAGLRPH